jgi:hypothetical protein
MTPLGAPRPTKRTSPNRAIVRSKRLDEMAQIPMDRPHNFETPSQRLVATGSLAVLFLVGLFSLAHAGDGGVFVGTAEAPTKSAATDQAVSAAEYKASAGGISFLHYKSPDKVKVDCNEEKPANPYAPKTWSCTAMISYSSDN